MTVYDDQRLRDAEISDDDLRNITGIGRGEEDAMDTRARRAATDGQLADAENGAAADPEGKTKTEPERKEANAITNFTFSGGKTRSGKKLGKKAALWGGGAGGGVLLLCFLLLFLLISQNKVVSFGHILAAAGYARFNGVMNERMTSDIFDAAVVEGNGSAALTGRSLLDRFTGKNLDRDLAELGRNDQFKMEFENGELKRFRIGSDTIDPDAIANDLFGVKSFKDADFFERMTIRNEVVSQTKAAAAEAMGIESRYLRSQLFDTMADNLGFGFSRWAEAARKYLGKSPKEADIQNRIENGENVARGEPVNTGVDEIDERTQEARKGSLTDENLRKLIDEGKIINGASLTELATGAINKELGTKIADAANAAGGPTILVTIACMAHEAFGHIPEVYNQNVNDLRRQALESTTARDQVIMGDTVSEAVNASNHQLDGGELSPYYQAAVGLPVDNEQAEIPRIKPKVSPMLTNIIERVSNPISYIPGASFLPKDWQDAAGDQFCNKLLSLPGQVVLGVAGIVAQAVVGVLTADTGNAALQAGSLATIKLVLTELKNAAVGTIGGIASREGLETLAIFGAYAKGLEITVNFLAGAKISGATSGDEYVTTIGLGHMIQDNIQLQTLYARPISDDEAKQTDQEAIGEDRAYQNSKGFTNRYFAISNPYSLANLAIIHIPTSFSSILGMVRNFFGHVGSIFQMNRYLALVPYGHRAYADIDFNPYDGYQQIGFSPSERIKMRTDPTYTMTANAEHLTDQQIKDYDEKYAKCFDPAISPYDLLDLQASGNLCSAEELGKDDVFRYRLYKLDATLGDVMNSSPQNSTTTSASTE